jgi:glyoxylate reductase
MAKPRVFVTRIIPDQGLNLVLEHCDANVWPHELPPDRAALLDGVRGVDGLLCLLTDRIDGEVMDAAGPQLKVISNHAVGVDNIDLSAAAARGIPVGNTPGILTDSTADMAFGLLMAAARRIVEGHNAIPRGAWKTWSPSFMLGVDVYRATLGIVGFGRIGQAVARRAAGFEMRILFYDPTPPAEPTAGAQLVDLDTLLAESDFVSIHTPLTPETRGMFKAELFGKMKPSAILINTARGPIVDQTALYAALKTRRIAMAAIDVTDPEPIPPDSPLLALDNLIITPHIASATKATREKMARMAAENLLAGLQGKSLPYQVR